MSAPPVTIGDHRYVSTGTTIAAWDMSGKPPKGPYRTSSTPEAGSIAGPHFGPVPSASHGVTLTSDGYPARAAELPNRLRDPGARPT